MPMKAAGSTALREIDRFEGGVGWIAYPDETMERASHALATDDGVWLVDPVDADGLDDLIAEFGGVAGVAVCLDRHKRDAAAIAARHDVAVHIPEWMTGVESKLDATVKRFGDQLGETGYRTFVVRDSSVPPWQEAGLYNPDTGTLVVPESVGTASYFVTDTEQLGVHPMLRLFPPKRALESYAPERILVGHGDGIHENASRILRDALDGSRGRTPALYGKTLKSLITR
ncbi:hypothetical protein [Halalkalirubrum salinum]|uniref:hypothetical protein n=1 Tax=Halalkalirubrum salinum TaxID=2563889 RepID=UPI00148546DA